MSPWRRLIKPQPSAAAAIDLGSNSFHMIVARIEGDQLRVVDRLREPVRLAGGLDNTRQLTAEAQERALDCLARFGQRLRDIPPEAIRVIGTNTLRRAKNARAFVVAAEQALGHEIEIVSGFEEARLIYLGVAHSLADDGRPRLVIDIGGGSTEFIVGEQFSPTRMESLHMGCVSMTRAWFDNGKISHKQWQKAVMAARMELEPLEQTHGNAHWERALGASGTIKAIQRVVTAQGWSDLGITRASLGSLKDALLALRDIEKINFDGVGDDRAPVFVGGVAILYAAFEALGIERMEVSDGALREGVLYDLVGRLHEDDVRGRTVADLQRRYHVEMAQAARVRQTADTLFEQLADNWGLGEPMFANMLTWAAELHEIGLDISHSQYHKHGAYILSYADMAGFAREEQQFLAALVRAHRRKFPSSVLQSLPNRWITPAGKLAVLLRLAVLMHRGRGNTPLPAVQVNAGKGDIVLRFPGGWLAEHPLLAADMAEEQAFLAAAGFSLTFE